MSFFVLLRMQELLFSEERFVFRYQCFEQDNQDRVDPLIVYE